MRRVVVRAAGWALLGAALALAGAAAAQDEPPHAVGDRIAALELADPHGTARRVDEATRGLLLSRDMDGGGLVREALAEGGAARLERAGAVYVADVHRMPGVIRRIVAIPRMRQRPYPVLLDTEGGPTARLPSRDGHATWLRLDGLRIVEVRFLTSAEEVRAALAVDPAGTEAGSEAPPGD